MNYFKISILSLSIIIFTDCTTNCGSDIELSSFQLLEESLPFFSYSSTQSLKFLDQDSIVHNLNIKYFNELYDTRVVTDILCSETLVGHQEEYYATTSKRIQLTDTLRGGYIDLILKTTMSNRENIDSTVVYDVLNIHCGTERFSSVSSKIVTGIHSDYNNDRDPREYLNVARLIGDTTINNINYEDVYLGTKGERGKIYYNSQDGVLGIYKDNNDFLTLLK